MQNETEKQRPNCPDFVRCQELWKQYQTPEHVIRHCRAVSDTAAVIALRLNEKGFRFDIPLLRAAGWLHDLCRTEDAHWEKSADIAAGLGYPALADIIRVHMQYQLNSKKETITETDLLCLADRTVKEDRYVGPDLRMDYILDKAKGDPQRIKRIQASFQEVRALKRRIESIIGCTFEKAICSE